MSNETKIRITCRGSREISPSELIGLQGELKSLSKTNYLKLRQSILDHGFSFPPFVWNNRIIDGHQRLKTLLKMITEEGLILERETIPVVDIEAQDEQEAKKKVLLAVSQYGRIESDGLYQFQIESSIPIEDLYDKIDLPNFNISKYQEEFFDKRQGARAPGEPEVEFSEILHESSNYIVLYFDNEIDWLQAKTLFELKTVKSRLCSESFVHQGIGRVLNGPKAIERLKAQWQVK